MKSNYKQLGEYIRQVDERNTEGKKDNLLGVSVQKSFIPSIANTVGTDFTKYKVVKRGQFTYIPDTSRRGDKIGIALLTDYDEGLVSNVYTVFEIIDKNQLIPEYLMLWFSRPEFDRYARYRSHGNAREIFDWNELCDVELPVPSFEEQKRIVEAYQTIARRIELKKKINDNLEATAQAYFDKLFIDGFECTTNLDKIANINPTRNLAKNQIARCFDMSTLPLKGCIPVGGEYKPYNGGMRFINGDTILARITPCLENGKAAYINILDENEVAFGSTEYIVLSPKENVPSSFFYFLARNSTFISYAVAHMNGSSGRQRVSGSDIANYPIKEPNKDELQMFDKYASKVLYEMKVSALEIEKLKELQENITATISGS